LKIKKYHTIRTVEKLIDYITRNNMNKIYDQYTEMGILITP